MPLVVRDDGKAGATRRALLARYLQQFAIDKLPRLRALRVLEPAAGQRPTDRLSRTGRTRRQDGP